MGKVKKSIDQQKGIQEREKQLDFYLVKHKIERDRNNPKPRSRKITYFEPTYKKQGEKGIDFINEKRIRRNGPL